MSTSYPSIAWPPQGIPSGANWTKDNVDTTPARAGGTLPKYKTTLDNTTAFYGKGQYIAFANSVLQIGGNDEWPPSGAFDKRDSASFLKTGWHIGEQFLNSGSDASPAALLYLVAPEQFALQSYTFKGRTDCCANQNPSAWQVHGSTDGTNWTLVDSRTGQTGSALGSSRNYTVNSTSYYNYYRFSILRNSGATTGSDWMHIAEVYIFGKGANAISMSNALSYGKSKISVPANGNAFSSFRGLGGIPSTGVLSFSTITTQLSQY